MMDYKTELLALIATDESISINIMEALKGLEFLSIRCKTAPIPMDIQFISEFRPNLIILDPNQSETEKISLVKKINLFHPEAKIIVVIQGSTNEEILDYMAAGARGVLERKKVVEKIQEAVSAVIHGGLYLDPTIEVPFLEKCGVWAEGASKKNREDLTNRENQVLECLAKGYTAKKAGAFLKMSPKTVTVHTANLMRKLNIHHRTDLIKYALRKKIIPFE